MRGQWIIAGLWLFVGAAFAGLYFAVLGPVPLIRVLGAVAMLGAVCGAILHTWWLRDAYPVRWTAFRHSLDDAVASGVARVRGIARPDDAVRA